MSEERRTLLEWSEKLGVIIMDADGFDRKDPNLWTNLYTEQEFREGLMRCTIKIEQGGRIHQEWQEEYRRATEHAGRSKGTSKS